MSSIIKVDTIQLADGTAGTIENLGLATGALSHRNLIINGAMQIAQRGTSFTSSSSIYTLDRWQLSTAVSATVTQETFTAGQTDVPNEPKNYLRFKNNSSSSKPDLIYKIEDVRTGAGQTLTLSFYAKASQSMTTSIYTTQIFGTGGSTSVGAEKGTIDLTTSWTKHTLTFSQASISGKTIGPNSLLQLYLVRILSGFSQNAYVDITNVQLEVGSVATPFEHRPYGEELARCQRYYQKPWNDDYYVSHASRAGTGWVFFPVPTPVTMRTEPSITHSAGTITLQNGSGTSSSWTPGSSDIVNWGFNQGSLTLLGKNTPTSITLGYTGSIYTSTSSTLEFDAEL